MAPDQDIASGTAPFSAFEWMIAGRYLRARRKEGFISVIAGFSFLGIMLGVATLIIVMAVMNGFRHDLFAKIMGLNGHVIVRSSVIGSWITMPSRITSARFLACKWRCGHRRPGDGVIQLPGAWWSCARPARE